MPPVLVNHSLEEKANDLWFLFFYNRAEILEIISLLFMRNNVFIKSIQFLLTFNIDLICKKPEYVESMDWNLKNRPPCQWGLPQFSTMGAFTQKKPQVLGDKLSTSDTVIWSRRYLRLICHYSTVKRSIFMTAFLLL
jgi:hypothetical protein